jgi:hypothetical protein
LPIPQRFDAVITDNMPGIRVGADPQDAGDPAADTDRADERLS